MAQHNVLGTFGEDRAVNHLCAQGYRILDRDWKCGRKDLDIVAADGSTLVFVEVKTRRDREFGNPEDAVTGRKIRNIVACADAYLRFRDIPLGTPVRFDVISIVTDGNRWELRHTKEAFFPPIWN